MKKTSYCVTELRFLMLSEEEVLINKLLVSEETQNTERYENKYLFKDYEKYRILSWLKSSKIGFRKHFEARKVSSIYFDSFDLKNYQANLNGDPNRIKPRLRWYNDDVLSTLSLELKIKRGNRGFKHTVGIGLDASPDNVENLFNFRAHNKILSLIQKNCSSESQIFSYIRSKFPIVEVTYERCYFVGADSMIRATLDTGIKYRSHGVGKSFLKSKNNVLEIKLPPTSDTRHIFQNGKFPGRVFRNSKYCSAVSATSRFLLTSKNWEDYIQP